jgi:hypothetical protein
MEASDKAGNDCAVIETTRLRVPEDYRESRWSSVAVASCRASVTTSSGVDSSREQIAQRREIRDAGGHEPIPTKIQATVATAAREEWLKPRLCRTLVSKEVSDIAVDRPGERKLPVQDRGD